MTLTKQELAKLTAQISSLAKKDSDFQQASAVTSGTDFTVLQNGTNKRVGANTVKGYILNDNVLNEITGKFTGSANTVTLQNMLDELFSRILRIEGSSTGENEGAGTSYTPSVSSNIDASGVTYSGIYHEFGLETVENLLDYILGILSGYVPFPGTATETDIMNILNQ